MLLALSDSHQQFRIHAVDFAVSIKVADHICGFVHRHIRIDVHDIGSATLDGIGIGCFEIGLAGVLFHHQYLIYTPE